MDQGLIDYDVALSFAGEDRLYVEQVARVLHSSGVRVFYDAYEEDTLWGRDLYQHLADVYQNSRYCVIFISAAYATKLWPKHELRNAQARAFSEKREYILPARFDDTEIPGVPKTVSYIDLRSKKPAELAELIRLKITSTGVLEDGKQSAGTSSGSVEFREVAESREVTYGGSGVAAALSCLKKTTDARLRWQVSRRLAELRLGQPFVKGPALTAWVKNDELFLSTLPGILYSAAAPPPGRLRVFVFSIEGQGIRLTKTLEFEGAAWDPIPLAAYRERFNGCYLDRLGADPFREAILTMLDEAGSRLEPPAVPDEAQVLRFGSFLKPQEKRPNSAGWDTDPQLVDPRIHDFEYGCSPAGFPVAVVRVQGCWSTQAISTLKAWSEALLPRRALVVYHDWGNTRLVVAKPASVRQRILDCLQRCIDVQYPVPWRPPLAPMKSASTDEWLGSTTSVPLSEKEWEIFDDKVRSSLRRVELLRPDFDGWSEEYIHGELPPQLPLDRLNWGP